MFDREPNIDFVFRNGLKEFEVLPPGDIWENIPPVQTIRHRYNSMLGVAAGLAVLVTLTLIASKIWKSNIDSEIKTQMAALINESEPLVKSDLMVSSAVSKISPAEFFSEELSVITLPYYEEPIRSFSGPSFPSLAVDDSKTLLVGKRLALRADNVDYEWATFPDITIDVFTPDNSLALLEKPETKGHRLYIGASLSPAYGFTESGDDLRLNELMSDEQGLTNYSTGLTVAYKLSPRFSLQSGIGLSSIGQMISGVDVFAGLSDYYAAKSNYLYSVETASGVILSSNSDLYISDAGNRVESFTTLGKTDVVYKYKLDLIATDIRQVFRYLEVPLVVRYKVIDRKVDLNLSGGMAYGILVENKAFADDGTNSVNIGSTEGVNSYNISSQVGLGMEYSISKQMSLNVEPVFRYYLTPFSELSSTMTRPYSFGLFSGFFFRF